LADGRVDGVCSCEVRAGTFSVQSGGVLNNVDANIRGGAAATVTGANAYWNCNGDANVGGSLTVQSGGHFNSANGYIDNAVATVAGTNSAWTTSQGIYLGSSGNAGTLSVQTGGAVISNGNDFVSLGSAVEVIDSGSTVNVAGGTWTSNAAGVILGYSGYNNVLSVAAGGVVHGSYIDVDQGGSITVDGAGSKLVLTTALALGTYGDGTLVLSHGGVLQTNSITDTSIIWATTPARRISISMAAYSKP
jgi:T5SS/PEP-CTERM-associated repeat protein